MRRPALPAVPSLDLGIDVSGSACIFVSRYFRLWLKHSGIYGHRGRHCATLLSATVGNSGNMPPLSRTHRAVMRCAAFGKPVLPSALYLGRFPVTDLLATLQLAEVA